MSSSPAQGTKTFDVRLLATASRECIYVTDNQPPACQEQWPGEPWAWCGACLATAVLKESGDA